MQAPQGTCGAIATEVSGSGNRRTNEFVLDARAVLQRSSTDSEPLRWNMNVGSHVVHDINVVLRRSRTQ